MQVSEIYRQLHAETANVCNVCNGDIFVANTESIKENLKPIKGILNEAHQQLNLDFQLLSVSQINILKSDVRVLTFLVNNEKSKIDKQKKEIEDSKEFPQDAKRLAEYEEIKIDLECILENAASLLTETLRLQELLRSNQDINSKDERVSMLAAEKASNGVKEIVNKESKEVSDKGDLLCIQENAASSLKETIRLQQLEHFNQFFNSQDERVSQLVSEAGRASNGIKEIVNQESKEVSDRRVLKVLQDVNTELAALRNAVDSFREAELRGYASFNPSDCQITESQYKFAREKIDDALTKIGRIRNSVDFFIDDSEGEFQHNFTINNSKASESLPNEQPHEAILEKIQMVEFLYNHSMDILKQSSLDDAQKGSLIIAHDEMAKLLVEISKCEFPEFDEIIKLKELLKQPLSSDDKQAIETKIESLSKFEEVREGIRKASEMEESLSQHLHRINLLDNMGLPYGNLILTFDNPLFKGPIEVPSNLFSETSKAYLVYYEHLSQIKKGTVDATKGLVEFDELLKKCVTSTD